MPRISEQLQQSLTENNQLRPVPEKPMKKVMQKFKSAEEFASSNLAGYGGKTYSAIAHLIDLASMTHINLSKIRKQLKEGGEWYFLHKIKITNLDTETHGKVQPTGKEDLSKPIVIGKNRVIVDGRHRVELAKKKGISELPAIMPAKLLYHLITR